MALCLGKITPQKHKTTIATIANLHSLIVKQQTTKQKRKGKLELEHLIKEQIEQIKQGRPWKEHWVMHLITLCGEMHRPFSFLSKQGMPTQIS
jgi:hypothetical protein